MGNKQNMSEKSDQVENLKSILAGFGITTSKELDDALSETLNALTLGIMTERHKKNSA
jgi:hypothetical protein